MSSEVAQWGGEKGMGTFTLQEGILQERKESPGSCEMFVCFMGSFYLF